MFRRPPRYPRSDTRCPYRALFRSVLALRRVPALRVLRRDLDRREPSAWAVIVLGLGGLAALLWWQAGSATLALSLLGGLLVTFGALALLDWLLIVDRKSTRLNSRH